MGRCIDPIDRAAPGQPDPAAPHRSPAPTLPAQPMPAQPMPAGGGHYSLRGAACAGSPPGAEGTDAPLADRPRLRCSSPPRALRPPTTCRAWAGDAPSTHRQSTLRVDTGTYVAERHRQQRRTSVDPPAGLAIPAAASHGQNPDSSVTRADVTVRGRVLNSFILATNFSFTGVTRFCRRVQPAADVHPLARRRVGPNAPQNSIVRGGVYWDLPRPMVSICRALDRKPASTSHSGTFDLRLRDRHGRRDRRRRVGRRRRTHLPLACPPAVAPEHIASFVDASLSSAGSPSI